MSSVGMLWCLLCHVTIFMLPSVVAQLTKNEVDMFRTQGVNVSDVHGSWHFTAPWPLGDGSATGDSKTIAIAQDPQVTRQPSCLPSGTIGLLVNGVPLLNPYANSGKVTAKCINPARMTLDDFKELITCILDTSETHSFIGVALDGHPIYIHEPPIAENDFDICQGTKINNRYIYYLNEEFPYIMSCFRGGSYGKFDDSAVKRRLTEECKVLCPNDVGLKSESCDLPVYISETQTVQIIKGLNQVRKEELGQDSVNDQINKETSIENVTTRRPMTSHDRVSEKGIPRTSTISSAGESFVKDEKGLPNEMASSEVSKKQDYQATERSLTSESDDKVTQADIHLVNDSTSHNGSQDVDMIFSTNFQHYLTDLGDKRHTLSNGVIPSDVTSDTTIKLVNIPTHNTTIVQKYHTKGITDNSESAVKHTRTDSSGTITTSSTLVHPGDDNSESTVKHTRTDSSDTRTTSSTLVHPGDDNSESTVKHTRTDSSDTRTTSSTLVHPGDDEITAAGHGLKFKSSPEPIQLSKSSMASDHRVSLSDVLFEVTHANVYKSSLSASVNGKVNSEISDLLQGSTEFNKKQTNINEISTVHPLNPDNNTRVIVTDNAQNQSNEDSKSTLLMQNGSKSFDLGNISVTVRPSVMDSISTAMEDVTSLPTGSLNTAYSIYPKNTMTTEKHLVGDHEISSSTESSTKKEYISEAKSGNITSGTTDALVQENSTLHGMLGQKTGSSNKLLDSEQKSTDQLIPTTGLLNIPPKHMAQVGENESSLAAAKNNSSMNDTISSLKPTTMTVKTTTLSRSLAENWVSYAGGVGVCVVGLCVGFIASLLKEEK